MKKILIAIVYIGLLPFMFLDCAPRGCSSGCSCSSCSSRCNCSSGCNCSGCGCSSRRPKRSNCHAGCHCSSCKSGNSSCCRPYGYVPKGCECIFKKKVKQKKEEKKLSNKEIIKKEYSKVAAGGCSCCSESCCGTGCGDNADLSKHIGYSQEELKKIPEANLGLGCGHPVSLGEIKNGYTVLDLGSGAGIDCFLAAKKVGKTGKVIGVDMTEAMIKKARINAKKYGFKNVEFRLGDIESMPVSDASIDIIISNCVINLVDDKYKVFKEAYRVLKPGGKMYVSDVVLLGDLTDKQKKDTKLLCACVSGALLKSDYVDKLKKAGFTVKIMGEDTKISKKWFNRTDLPIESMKFIAFKKS